MGDSDHLRARIRGSLDRIDPRADWPQGFVRFGVAACLAVVVALLDVILGYGAHPDPAGELAPAIEAAITTAVETVRSLTVVVSLCGTESDPQGLEAQRERLEAAGAVVYRYNVLAAGVAAGLARGTS